MGRTVDDNVSDVNEKIELESELSPLEIPEILAKILSYWAIEDRLSARLVCRKWRDVLQDSNRCVDGQMLRFKPLLSNDEICHFLKSTEVFDSAEFWHFSKPIILSDENKFPNVCQRVKIGVWNSSENVIKILKYCCQNVKFLIFGELSLACLDNSLTTVLQNLHLPLLNDLCLSVPEESPFCNCNSKNLGQHCSALKLILQHGNFPNLKKFWLGLNTKPRSCDDKSQGRNRKKVCISVPIYSAFYGFIDRHAKTVKFLELGDGLECKEKKCPWGGISSTLDKSILENLKLETLSIHYGSCLMLPCLMGSDRLLNFSCDLFRGPDDPKSMNLKKLTEMLQRNQQNLVELDMSAEPVAISILEDLTGLGLPCLKKLHLRVLNNIPRLKFCIPTLTALKIDFFRAMPDWDTWIIESFENLEIIHVSDTVASNPNVREYDNDRPLIAALELHNLLRLKKIRQLSYGTANYIGQKLKLLGPFFELNPNIRDRTLGFDYHIMTWINLELGGVPEVVTTFFIPSRENNTTTINCQLITFHSN